MDYRSKFAAGLSYQAFLDQYATDEQRARWRNVYDHVSLDEASQSRVAEFTRQVRILCMAGAWCGDCVEQCPILQRIAEANPCLELRFIDRDADAELAAHLQVCGAPRVPQVVFLNEDDQFLGHYGDRTLAKYRQMAQTQLGAACPTGLGVDHALTAHVRDEWVAEFERIHWIVRLSPRLRERHGD